MQTAPPPVPVLQDLRFDVQGMHCAACAGRLERVLGKVDGVREAHVSFAGGSAHLRVDGPGPGLGALRRAVQQAGFDVPRQVPPADEAATARAADAAEVRQWAVRAALAWAMGALVIAAGRGALGDAGKGVQLVASLVASAGAGWPFFAGAWAATRNRTASMDTLVALGASLAWGFSAALLLVEGRQAETWFEAAAWLPAFLLLGRTLDQRARGKAREAVRGLLELRVGEAEVQRGDGQWGAVPASALEPGDRIRVAAGGRVPVDARVVQGRSAVDTSAWTGEPLPVAVGPGDEVLGGSANGSGALVVEATRVGADSALEQIIALLRQAQEQTAPIQDVADRVAAVFVPVILGVAALVGAGWWLAGAGLPAALERFVTVIVVACPCALGLATPAAVLVGTGAAARRGVLFRSGGALQALASVTDLVVDKTGTLTAGRPAVVSREVPDVVLARAAAAELGAGHPLSAALVDAAGPDLPEAEDVQVEPGRGLSASVQGHTLRVGSPAWFDGRPDLERWSVDLASAAERGETLVIVEQDGVIEGWLGLADPARPEAAAFIADMGRRGVALHLLSGDHPGAVATFARSVGLAADSAHGGLSPAHKQARVAALAAEGRRVAMLGDGINDAPALASALVGIAMGSGAEVAVQAGDVTVLRDDLSALGEGWEVSRRTMAVVRQNLAFAVAYNVLLVPVAAGLGMPWGIVIGPIWASAAMALSSISVLANALRLQRTTS